MSRFLRRFWLLLVFVFGTALVSRSAVPVHADGTCATSGNLTTCAFAYTGDEQALTLPDGVTEVQVLVVGAPGATSGDGSGAGAGGASSETEYAADGGGGGGSSYLDPSATLDFTGVDGADNPTIVVTYAQPNNTTDARVSAFSVQHTVGHLTATWRARYQANVIGFAIRAGSQLLDRSLIAVHSGAHYTFKTSFKGHGPYALAVYLRDGRTMMVTPAK